MINIVLCGTPEFVQEFFDEFVNNSNKYCVKGVITRSTKIVNNKYNYSSIAIWATKNNLSLYAIDDINSNVEVLDLLKQCDLVLVFAYGKIISQKLLNIPKYGWINIHPSLLPQLRGPSPVQYALLNNIQKSALTLMKLNSKMDEGDVIAQKIFYINPFHNLNAVFFELSCWGPKWVIEQLDLYLQSQTLKSQDHKFATYSFMIKNKDYHISQDENLDLILRKIKAFGYVFFYYDGLIVKCFSAKKFEENDLININGISPIFVQLPGKKIMHIRVFLNGFRKKLV